MSQLNLTSLYAESMTAYSSQNLHGHISWDIAKQYHNPFSLFHDSEFTMLYFHRSQKIPSRYRIDSRFHATIQVCFHESLPIFSCRSGLIEPQIFCFSLLPHKEKWASHFYGFIEHYVSKYLLSKPYPSIVRMSFFKGIDFLYEGLHPYILLYYRMFLHRDTPIVENLRNSIDCIIDTFDFFWKTDIRKEFAHWRIDTGLISPHPIEVLGLSGLLPSEPQYSNTLPQDYIYAICQEGTTLIKIGRTTNPDARLKNLQIGSGVPLTMKYLWRVSDAVSMEGKLHKRFENLRIQGEWFRLSLEDEAELIACMDECQRVTL